MFKHLSNASRAEDTEDVCYKTEKVAKVEGPAEDLIAEVDAIISEDDDADELDEACEACGGAEHPEKPVCWDGEDDDAPEEGVAAKDPEEPKDPTKLPAHIHEFFSKLAL